MGKIRLDKCVTDLGLFDSRENAKKAIMAGLVLLDGVPHTKAGEQVDPDLEPGHVTVKGRVCPFVSRGGLKLAKGFEVFPFDVTDRTVMDIGASTGGFTDCLLQHGAKKVFAIDVGYGQLDWKLRQDPRVVCMEQTNFRYLEASALPEPAEATVMDVSFISILKLMPKIAELTVSNADGVWLIKPQFEAGREDVGKNGVVRDAKVHSRVLQEVTVGIAAAGFTVMGLDSSPIRGPKGNVEFLCLTRKGIWESPIDLDSRIEAVVKEVHTSGEV